jgi:hypothetical protein
MSTLEPNPEHYTEVSCTETETSFGSGAGAGGREANGCCHLKSVVIDRGGAEELKGKRRSEAASMSGGARVVLVCLNRSGRKLAHGDGCL